MAPMPPLEGDKEINDEKGIKTLTPNKLLIRLPVLFTKLKVENNSNKLKHEIRQRRCLLYQHNKITKKLHNSLIKSLTYESVH